MNRSRVLVLSLLLVIGLGIAPRAAADDLPMGPEAYAHLQRGLDAYKAKDYPKAIAEFAAGYALDPRKEFLFAWAQAERLAGDCGKAIDLYEKFIASGPSSGQQQAAQQNIDRCREALQVQPAPPADDTAPPPRTKPDDRAEVGPAIAPPPAAAAHGADAAAPRAWWKDGWGAGLVGAGVVSLGVGVGFSLAAGSSADAADRAPSYDEFAARQDEAAGRRTMAAVAYGTGIGLVAAGAVRYYMVRGRHPGGGERAAGKSVAFTLRDGGASLWVAGEF